MTRRLVLSYLLIAAFVLLLVEVPLGATFAGRARDRLLADVERDARVLAVMVEEHLEAGDVGGARSLAEGYARRTGGRVVVTDSSGSSLLDTAAPSSGRRDFSTRPEIRTAMSGTQDTGIRRSTTLDSELAYAAVPVSSGGRLIGVVRISFPTTGMRQQVRTNLLRLVALSLLVLGAVGCVGWLVARWAVAPIDELERGAERLAGGDLSGRASVGRGPPELRQLADTFNDMAARVESLVESQRAFVADGAHQLRTPLTVLRLRIESIEEALESGSAEPGRLHGDVEVILDELDRLTLIVEGLLALARAEGGTPVVSLDVAAIARSAVQRWDALAEERGVELRLDVPAGGVTARCVEHGTDQILDNLLDNALDVAPVGSVVDVAVWGSGEVVTISVRDRGPGLTASEQSRATDRFWRAPGAPSGGTGLGLAVVEELARTSGGSVDLHDPPSGPGLVADVHLPIGRPAT